MFFRFCSMLLIGFCPGLLQAESGLAQRALERMSGIEMDRWAYERVQVSREHTRVDQHDPSRAGAEHWQLVSIDGRMPTPKEFGDYSEKRSRHDKEGGKTGSGRELVSMLVPGSLVLLSSDKQGFHYAFRVRSPDGRKKRQWERISGELHVFENDGDPYVGHVRLWNTESVRPRFGLLLDRVELSMDFFMSGRAVLPSRLELSYAGRFWFLIQVDEDLSYRFHGFQPVPSGRPPDAGADSGDGHEH